MYVNSYVCDILTIKEKTEEITFLLTVKKKKNWIDIKFENNYYCLRKTISSEVRLFYTQILIETFDGITSFYTLQLK